MSAAILKLTGEDSLAFFDAIAPVEFSQRFEFRAEDPSDLLSHLGSHPAMPIADHFGVVHPQERGASDRCSQLVATRGPAHEGFDSFAQDAVVHERGQIVHHALDLQLGGDLEQSLHVFEVAEDGSSRDVRLLGHLFG